MLDPEHFFDQADELVSQNRPGAPRQVDLRRAISSAYYGVFHSILGAAADEFVGAAQRSSARYALVYRSIDHRALRDLCAEMTKANLPARYARYAPRQGFGSNIQEFAQAFLELYEMRNNSDYDPLFRVRVANAASAVRTARTALRRFAGASRSRRKMFLTLLLFPPR